MSTTNRITFLTLLVLAATMNTTVAASQTPKYVSPLADILLPAPNAGESYRIQPMATYQCIGKTAAGYLILLADAQGRMCARTLPWRDRMGNPSANEAEGTVKVHPQVMVQLTAGYIPLIKGEPYRLITETPETYWVRFCSGSFTQDVQVAKNKMQAFVPAFAPETLAQLRGVVRLYTRTRTFPCTVIESDGESLLIQEAEGNKDVQTHVPFIAITGVVAVAEYKGRYYTSEEIKTLKLSSVAKQGNSSSAGVSVTNAAGRVYANCTVKSVEPDGITFFHSKGVAKVLFTELSEQWRMKYNYDPQKAEQYAKEMADRRTQRAHKADESTAQTQSNGEFSGSIIQVADGGVGALVLSTTAYYLIKHGMDRPGLDTRLKYVEGDFSQCVDGQKWSGKIIRTGTYQYESASGGTMTVEKYRLAQ